MSRLTLSIEDAVSKIIASPAPVLFPDTCALVDLIRLPFRVDSSKIAKETLEAASYLAAQSKNKPPNLWVVIPPLVPDEWNEHSLSTIKTLEQYWTNLDKMIEITHTVANAVTIALPSAETYSDRKIKDALVKLSTDFFKNAIFLADDADCKEGAYQRVIRKQAPSRKSAGLKDCVIIEHSLKLCSQLRATGFSYKCVFLTSNTKDFCKPGSNKPQVPLDSQLDNVQLFLTTNWQWTRHELGI